MIVADACAKLAALRMREYKRKGGASDFALRASP